MFYTRLVATILILTLVVINCILELTRLDAKRPRPSHRRCPRS